jgi:hypothetical protein
MIKETKIHGYEIWLDTDCDGVGDQSPDRVTSCCINKGDQSGSLELARALDGLEDRDGNFFPMSNQTFFAIEKWALAHGY